MTNIVNFERDQVWTGDRAFFNALTAAFGVNLSVQTSGVVGERVNNFGPNRISTTAAGTVNCAGCQILEPPDGDRVPYRFIASATDVNTMYWGFGYQSATTASAIKLFAVGPTCDLVVNVDPLDSGDPNYGKPLCFFGCMWNETVASNQMMIGSVQRLIAKPPQFASAVS